MRSTFDVDPEPADSPADSTAIAVAESSADEVQSELVEALQAPQRRTRRGGSAKSVTSAPPSADADMLVRRRAPRTTNSTYRHIGAPSGPKSPITSTQKVRLTLPVNSTARSLD
jgi:hypothetical protein